MRGDRAPFSVSRCFQGLGERVGTGEAVRRTPVLHAPLVSTAEKLPMR